MKEYTKITKAILHWYEKNARDLPWRHTHNPYKIWVSEIMLQQTQVSRVIVYYKRFLEKFPNIGTLAQAQWEDFLPVWRGLGFYSRGKNMLKTAKIIVQEHDGEFPTALESLPGIGPYTAAAMKSFAYGQSEPAIDTNLERIFQRYFGCSKKGVIPRAKALFSTNKKEAPSMNHALMDLGSEICKSRKVNCKQCPLHEDCYFLHSEQKEKWQQSLISGRIGKKVISKKIPMEVAVACIQKNGKYLIAKRRKEKGGNWEFPGGKREKGEDWRHCIKREVQEELGVEISARPHFFEETWEEGDYFWRLRFSRCQILSGQITLHEHTQIQWVLPSEFKKYSLPEANKKAITKLMKMKMS